MTTPMIILCLLLVPLLASCLMRGARGARFGGTLGIALAFAFFGVGHFVQTEAMVQMLPPFIPFATPLVLATGLLELAISLGLLHPSTRRLAGHVAIAVLILFLPVNVYAAIHHTGMGGHVWGPVYLLIRVPLQLFLICWTWIFALRPIKNDKTAPLPTHTFPKGIPNA